MLLRAAIAALLSLMPEAFAQSEISDGRSVRTQMAPAPEGGVVVSYVFPEPTASLRLAGPISQAVDRVTLDGMRARLSGGAADCGRMCEFKQAELLRYGPATPGYPDLIEAGECGLWADVSAFAPLDPQTDAPLTRSVTVAGAEIELTGDRPQYEAVRAPERTPVCAAFAALPEDRLAASVARMAADYGAIFGHLPPGAPRVHLAPAGPVGPGVNGVRGAAVGDGLVFLFAESDPAPARDAVLAVLSHEIAHLWIGRRARLHPQFDQAWITEGAAEYLSLKQLLRIDAVESGFVLAQLSRHVNACLYGLPERRLALNHSTQAGRFPYNCGALVAFFADQAAQAAGSSFEAAMADMVADPVFRSGQATGLDYRRILFAHTGVEAEQAFDGLVVAPVSNKAARLAALLQQAGLGEIADTGEGARRHLAALAARHVTRLICPDGGGSFTLDEGVVLDLPRSCSGPAGTSELTAVAGAAPLEGPRAALEALAGCGPGETIEVRLGVEDHRLSCHTPLAPYVPGFTLDEARAEEILSHGP